MDKNDYRQLKKILLLMHKKKYLYPFYNRYCEEIFNILKEKKQIDVFIKLKIFVSDLIGRIVRKLRS